MAPADQGLIRHPHIKSSWRTVRLDMPGDRLETVLVVETDLILNPDNPDHDGVAFGSMATAIREYLERNDNVDRATVYPIGGG